MKLQKRVAVLGILLAQALILGLIETMIPITIPVPGIKLGLANLITLFAISTLGLGSALMIVMARSVLSFFIVGVFSSFLFSLAGGICSCLVMYLFKVFLSRNIGIISTSVMGALTHNLAQLGVASLLMQTTNVFSYTPILLVSGLITGIIIGIIAQYTINPCARILRIGSDRYVE